MSQALATLLAAAISAALGGLSAAIVTYTLTRRKTDAETEKIRAETDKTRLEILQLSKTVTYALANVSERVILDGREHIDPFDIRGVAGCFWQGRGTQAKPISPKGEGNLQFHDGILDLQRTNSVGRFELIVQRYLVEGRSSSLLSKDVSIGGQRMLRLSCDAKAIGGAHTLRFVVRNPSDGTRFSEDTRRISGNEWMPIEVYLTADPSVDCQIRLDDEDVALVPSSLQIRRLLIAERLS